MSNWIVPSDKIGYTLLFSSYFYDHPHISTRQYGRLVLDWVILFGLDLGGCGMHSMRRTKVADFHRKTGTFRAVQHLLGHTMAIRKV